ncbi:disintegrin and metalloproteinase domain-containing protein 2-like [Passerculus sandwichensis]
MHKEAVSYTLRIEGKPYTIHLQQHAFLSDDFQTYVASEQGSLHADSAHSEGGCHYRGYIAGFPSSAVTLNTCSGLRGLLQFENVSYSIQPLGYSPAFQHVLYRPLSAAAQAPKFLTVYVVLDKALYNYMGSDPNAATQNVIQAFNLINNMFNPLNITIVLSSLELWAEGDKISTAGDTDDILQRFLQWKQLSLEPQAHNIASLLGSPQGCEQHEQGWMGHMGGSVSLQGALSSGSSLFSSLQYHGNVTLESFSVLLAQVLGHSLGVSPDSPRGCSCPARVCTMSPEALYFSGSKAFSNCSIRDFESFLKQGRGDCLFSSPRLSRQSRQSGAVCGNGVVEPGEQCDCGTAQECLKDRCCTPNCRLKPRAKCASGLCCRNCQFKWRNTLCRPAADAQCDLPEFCSGSSASCPPDVYVQDGQECWRGTGYCYQGRCQSPDLQCRRIYGTDSKNAPVMCYEEINGQRDRFGHCGFERNHKYRRCVWRDLRCGKLVCTYPSHKPFLAPATAVMYARVKHHICVTLNYLNVSTWLDPLLVTPGTKCGSGRQHKVPRPRGECQGCWAGWDKLYQPPAHLYPSLALQVCNNKGNCHCNMGWQPPDCQWRGSRHGGSVDSGLQFTEGGVHRSLDDGDMAWLVLGSCLILLLLMGALGLGLWRQQMPGQRHGEWAPGTQGAKAPLQIPHSTSQDTGSELQPDLERNLEPEQELKREPGLERNLEPDLEVKREPGLEVKREPDLELKREPHLELKWKPGLKLNLEPGLKLHLEPDLELKWEPDLELQDPELAPELQTDTELEPELEMKTNTDPPAEPALGQHHGH